MRGEHHKHPATRRTIKTAYPRLRGEHCWATTSLAAKSGLPPLARGAHVPWPAVTRQRGPTPACAGSTCSIGPSSAACWAYPRLRGEHCHRRRGVRSVAGLPPLARGALLDFGPMYDAAGPTPACAGSTRTSGKPAGQRHTYPRLRGEHTLQTTGNIILLGLPPLARGAPCASVHRQRPRRPTPACAGSTTKGSARSLAARAYPRLRGEHTHALLALVAIMGLPPLARGAHTPSTPKPTRTGPTPACAGSTFGCRRTSTAAWAYPRLRGEHQSHRSNVRRDCGLPPLARGAPHRRHPHSHPDGPTPACAGSTTEIPILRDILGAYPRLRGEHAAAVAQPAGGGGLPPLARGAPGPPTRRPASPRPTPACAGSTRLDLGSGWPAPGLPPLARGAPARRARRPSSCRPTPACAGSTWRLPRPCRTEPAYPRLRGEHTAVVLTATPDTGLPPLARGAPEPPPTERTRGGPTPACAGSTAMWLDVTGDGGAYPRLRGEHGLPSRRDRAS